MSITYRSAAWKRAAAVVLAEETICHLCGHPIDFDAPARTRYSPSVDHVIPLSKGGDMLARENLRAAHFGCNSSKREGRGIKKTRTSRMW